MSDPIINPNIEWDEDEQVFKGKFIVGQDNDIVFKVKNDKTIDEGNETLSISIQNIDESGLDSITGKSVNDSSVKNKNVNIVDSSRSPKFLSLVADKNTLNEKEISVPSPEQPIVPFYSYRSTVNDNTKLTLTATGQDFLTADDGQIAFEVVGTSGDIGASDFNPNNLRGYLTVQNDTTAVGELFVNQDFLEEGEERFRVRIADNPLIQTDEIVILDTSIPQPVFRSIDIVPVDVIRESEPYKIVSGDFSNNSEGWILHEASHSNEYGGSIKMTEISGGTGQRSKIGKIVEYDFVQGRTYKFRVKVEHLSNGGSYASITLNLHLPDRFVTDGNWKSVYPSIHFRPLERASVDTSYYYNYTDTEWLEVTYVCDAQLASEGRVLMALGHTGNLETANIGGYEVIDPSIIHSAEGDSFHVYLNGQNLTNYSYPQTSLYSLIDKNDDGSEYITFDNPDGNDNWFWFESTYEHIHRSYIPESRFNDDSRILLDTIKILPDDNVNDSNREFTLSFRFYKMVDNFTYALDSLSSEVIVLPDIPVYDSFVASPSAVNETDNNVVTLTLSGTNITYEGERIQIRMGYNNPGPDTHDFQIYSGYLTGVDRNTATGTITVKDDGRDEDAESFYIYLDSNNSIRTNNVTILDTASYNSITPSPTSINEGGNVTFTLNGSDMLNGETNLNWELYEISSGLSFSTSTSDNFEVKSNTTQTITTVVTMDDGDYTGTKSFRLRVKDGSGNILSTSPTVNVLDDEFSGPVYTSITPSPTSVTEGGSVTFTLNGSNMKRGVGADTNLYWELYDISSDLSFSTSTSGNFQVISDTAQTITTVGTMDDGDYTGTKSFRLRVRTAAGGSEILSSSTVNVLDDEYSGPVYTSITHNAGSDTTITEGDSVTFTLNGSNMKRGIGADTNLYWELDDVWDGNGYLSFLSTSGNFEVINDTTQTITTVVTIDDNYHYEGPFRLGFRLKVRTAAGGSEILSSQFITVLGNDAPGTGTPPPVVTPTYTSLVASPIELDETNNKTTTITLNGTNLNSGSMNYYCTIKPVSAGIEPSDFESNSLSLSLDTISQSADGSATATGTITVRADSLTEAETETFYVQFNDESQGILRTDNITIDDTSQTPVVTPTYASLVASPIELDETNNKTTTITLTGTNLSGTYECEIVPVSAGIEPSDFESNSLNVTLNTTNGSTTQATGTITVRADSKTESNIITQTEIFYVRLIDDTSKFTSNITIGDTSKDPVVTPTYASLVASDTTLNETDNTTTTITLTGTNLSGSYTCSIVNSVSSSNTAEDFEPNSLSITLNTTNGSTTQATGTITVATDYKTEVSSKNLQTGYVTVRSTKFYVRLDDDPSIRTPDIEIDDTSVTNDPPDITGNQYLNYIPLTSYGTQPIPGAYGFKILTGHFIWKWNLSPNLGDGWFCERRTASNPSWGTDDQFHLTQPQSGDKFSSEFDLGPDPISFEYLPALQDPYNIGLEPRYTFKHGNEKYNTIGQTNSPFGGILTPQYNILSEGVTGFDFPEENELTVWRNGSGINNYGSTVEIEIELISGWIEGGSAHGNPAHGGFPQIELAMHEVATFDINQPWNQQEGQISGMTGLKFAQIQSKDPRLYVFAITNDHPDFSRFNSGDSFPYKDFEEWWGPYESGNPFKNNGDPYNSAGVSFANGNGVEGFYINYNSPNNGRSFDIYYSDGWSNNKIPYIGIFEAYRPTPDSDLIPSKVRIISLEGVWWPAPNGWG